MNLSDPPRAEQPVWDWLDAHAIPFRTPAAAWVESFGAPPEWPAVRGRRRRMCRCEPRSDLFPDQLEALGFDLDCVAGPPGPPAVLIARGLTVPSAAAAAERVTAAITSALGPPTEPSWPHHRVWTRGLARVTLRAGTPDTRYAGEGIAAYAQRRASALEVEIEPGIAAPLSPDERDMVAQATRLADGACVVPESLFWPRGLSPGVRRLLGGVAPTLRFSQRASMLIITRGDDALLLPAGEVQAVRVLNTLPAKGGGSAKLGFDLTMPYPPETRVKPWRPHTGWLLGGMGTEVYGLDPLAETLSGLLGASAVTAEAYDA